MLILKQCFKGTVRIQAFLYCTVRRIFQADNLFLTTDYQAVDKLKKIILNDASMVILPDGRRNTLCWFLTLIIEEFLSRIEFSKPIFNCTCVVFTSELTGT